MQYTIIPANSETRTPEIIQRVDDDGQVWSIPTDPANADYASYLAYVANGNQMPTPPNPLASQENN